MLQQNKFPAIVM